MSERTVTGLGVLAAATALGLLADGLLRRTPWGLNVFVWMLSLAGAMLAVGRRRRERPQRSSWLLLPVLVFAASFAWRDSPTLIIVNTLALLVAIATAASHTSLSRMRVFSLLEYGSVLLAAWFHAQLGAIFLVFQDVRWREVGTNGWTRNAFAVSRGVLLAVPILFVFGGLLVAADAVFERLVFASFDLGAEALIMHAVVAGAVAWAVAGYLRGLVFSKDAEVRGVQRPQFLSLGIVEIAVVLGLLDALFLAFVAVQLRYLFGGAGHVASTMGLTYAEYARQGFFELVTVAALVLPLLLGGHWLLRTDHAAHERLFRVLAGIQVSLLFVIMASAAQRMRLYQIEYGMTELRLYTIAFMGWLALVFAWFSATVLRGRRERFASGALVSGYAAILVLNLANPDAAIVRANAARAAGGYPFDAAYNVSLSADAVPALLASLPVLDETERCAVSWRLLDRWADPDAPDWRTWNHSRARAVYHVEAHTATLRVATCRDTDGPVQRQESIDGVQQPFEHPASVGASAPAEP